MKQHPIFRNLWYAANALLIVSLLFLLYAAGWEFSTRSYLKGFSDAIVPVSAPPEERVAAILSWMEHGPARRTSSATGPFSLRDPQETLNYQALLQICGSATNAFVNLANSSGVPSRRLLLLNQDRRATHVVAEVYMNGRWVVVDPVFHIVLRGADQHPLTRNELIDPKILAQAAQGLVAYDASYTYERTAHLRMSRIPVIGSFMRRFLDRVLPGWEDSVYWTLLVERESFGALVGAVFLVLFAFLARMAMRGFGESRLGIHHVRVREHLRRAGQAFLSGVG
jgi:hypothetical protein